jgi:hypothetical protein
MPFASPDAASVPALLGIGRVVKRGLDRVASWSL